MVMLGSTLALTGATAHADTFTATFGSGTLSGCTAPCVIQIDGAVTMTSPQYSPGTYEIRIDTNPLLLVSDGCITVSNATTTLEFLSGTLELAVTSVCRSGPGTFRLNFDVNGNDSDGIFNQAAGGGTIDGRYNWWSWPWSRTYTFTLNNGSITPSTGNGGPGDSGSGPGPLSATPELSSLLLMSVGSLLVGGYIWRQRRKA
jgi:hypothetical protein